MERPLRVFAFEFSKAFDSVNHFILFNEFKGLPVNLYVINWVLSFLSGRQQHVIANGAFLLIKMCPRNHT